MTRWQETAAELGVPPHTPSGVLGFVRSGWAATYPTVFESAGGAHARDASGRRYVDWVMGKGNVTLGHALPAVDRAAYERARRGVALPGVSPEYGALAARLAARFDVIESAAFAKNGSDAVSIAMRLARVFTGRERVLSAGYHGWDARRGVLDFGYDLAALEEGLAEPTAAVLVTPEPAFHDAARAVETARLAREAGALLIYDEVRCGMRLPGGAHGLRGVRPDLVTLSKGLANGYPISAVGGRRDVMDASARTYVFGTSYAEALSRSPPVSPASTRARARPRRWRAPAGR